MKDFSTRVMVFAFPTVHSRYPALDAPPTSFTQKPDALRDGKERFEQRVAELFEFASRPDLRLTGASSSGLLAAPRLGLGRPPSS